MSKLTKELLEATGINDFRLMPNGNNLVLVFMFPDEEHANRYMNILQTHPFNVRYLIGEKRNHVFEIVFETIVQQWTSERVEEKYPVVGRMHLGINHVTTGYLIGNAVQYNTRFIPMSLIRNSN